MNMSSKYCRRRMEKSGNSTHPEPLVQEQNSAEYVDLNQLGAVTTKGVANVPWPEIRLRVWQRFTVA